LYTPLGVGQAPSVHILGNKNNQISIYKKAPAEGVFCFTGLSLFISWVK